MCEVIYRLTNFIILLSTTLPAPTSGFGGTCRIIGKISSAGTTTHTGNFSLSFRVHTGKSTSALSRFLPFAHPLLIAEIYSAPLNALIAIELV